MIPGANVALVPDAPASAKAVVRVLLIEDNEDDAILARRDLARDQHCEFEVDWASTLEEGLERLRRGGIDVVLLDLSLPDCRGLTTFERLNSAFRHLPIVVLSGHDDEDTAVQAVRLGAQDYLVKGQMTADSMTRAISYAIERKRVTWHMAILAEELAMRNAVLREELDLAHEIQRALLPGSLQPLHETAEPRPWVMAHRYLPTESLAGDFFKAYALSEGRIGILICDVMGHGVRSALIAALLCGLIEEFEFEREAPGLMLTRLNAGLSRVLGPTRAKMFATACYVVVDPAKGQLHLSIAGHPGPYLLRRAAAQVERLVPCRGPALGLFEAAEFPEATVPIAADDLLLLYTDGISEVEGPDGEFFEARLPEALSRHAGQEVEDMLDDLIGEARRFSCTGGFHDDVCLIALQVGRAADATLTPVPVR